MINDKTTINSTAQYVNLNEWKETNNNMLNCYNLFKSSNLENYTYKTSFPNLISENLIYLSMWQYWWWFWFNFLVILYYFFFTKLIFNRLLKINPKILTSVKSHGRWGDFIIGIIPIYWCLNILLNSNTLLKMTEWQIESNIFSLRIRGKQWYWVYKIDAINASSFTFLKKNIGNNQILSKNSVTLEDKIFKLIEQKTEKRYYKKKSFVKIKNKKTTEFETKFSNFKNKNAVFKYEKKKFNFLNKNYLNMKKKKKAPIESTQITFEPLLDFYSDNYNIKLSRRSFSKKTKITTNNICFYGKYLYRFEKRVRQLKLPTYKFNDNFIYSVYNDLHKSYKGKVIRVNKKWKAKVYKHYASVNSVFNKLVLNMKIFDLKKYHQCTHLTFRTERIGIADKSNIFSTGIFKSFGYYDNLDKFNRYDYILELKSYNKQKNDSASRLLTSKEILILPANIDTSITTNSFDVVHSWFVPGLGIKMDCVPGRATHHTFLFEVYGLFFGQCAEICGRFHHHMPIQLAIVHFEMFILWWNNVAIKKFFRKK